MNLIGTAAAHTDGVLGSSGHVIRVWDLGILWNDVTTASVNLCNGTDNTGTILMSNVGTKAETAWIHSASGVRFDKGCYIDYTSAASQNIVINYEEEF